MHRKKSEKKKPGRKQMFDPDKTINYLIKKPPIEFERFKNQCAREGRSISGELRRIVERVANGKDDLVPPPEVCTPFLVRNLPRDSWERFIKICRGRGLTAKEGLMIKVREKISS